MKATPEDRVKKWKNKAKVRGELMNRLTKKLLRRDQKIEYLEREIRTLKMEEGRQKARYGRHPIFLVYMAVFMCIECNISLRGCAKSLCRLAQLMGIPLTYISPSTIRNWCLKFGYHLHHCPIEKGKYVLILDESVEIGKERLMLSLIVPISQCNPCAPLQGSDVIVLDMAVQHSWTGAEVASRIQKRIEDHDIEIAYAISDKASLLKKCFSLMKTRWVGDCTHAMANAAQRIFKGHEGLEAVVQETNAIRCKWILSKHNLLVPPCLRVGSRFNQLFVLHKWALKILDKKNLSKEAREGLQYLWKHRKVIMVMKDIHDLIELFSNIFKGIGITKQSQSKWKKATRKYRRKHRAWETIEFVKAMDNYLLETRQAHPNLDRILCCSDIIESTFGKYKNKGGAKIITDDILRIPAYSRVETLAQTKIAMEEVKIVDLQIWKGKCTTVSKLALIKREKLKGKKSVA